MPEPPLLPPFGGDPGPQLTTEDLLVAFADGEPSGWSPEAMIDGASLVAATGLCAALRLPGAFLVRSDVPDGAEEVRDRFIAMLEGRAWEPVERDAVLAGVVGIEMAGERGASWDLWADDPERGREVLIRRALGDLADHLDFEGAQQRAAIDAAVAELEQRLRREG